VKKSGSIEAIRKRTAGRNLLSHAARLAIAARTERPKNPWLRKTIDADPIAPGEPYHADLFRGQTPPLLITLDWTQANADELLSFGNKLTLRDIAWGIHTAALYYRQGQGTEDALVEQTAIKRKLKRSRNPSKIKAAKLLASGKGEPVLYGDRAFIWKLSELLQAMKGNQRIGWTHWGVPALGAKDIDEVDPDFKLKGRWKKSEVQKFCELIYSFVDPYRTDLPSSRYYGKVKEKRGLVMPAQ
jgi:hypothetical protein